MNYGIIHDSQFEEIESLLNDDLVDSGVQCCILVDTAGNIVAKQHIQEFMHDPYVFSALAAGNYAAVDSIAKMVGLNEFSLLYHKGRNVSVYFRKISEDLILINIFDNKISIGILRERVTDVAAKIGEICNCAIPVDEAVSMLHAGC